MKLFSKDWFSRRGTTGVWQTNQVTWRCKGDVLCAEMERVEAEMVEGA